jgi:hypothetical protein
MSRSGFRSVAGRLWLLPLAGLAVLYVWEVTHHWFSTSDTQGVLLGTAAAENCAKAGTVTNCIGAGFDVSHYPPLQFIPTLVMKELGASLQQAYQGLCWLNAVAYAGTLGILWHVGWRSRARALAPLLLACGLAAPLLWYSHSGFREDLSAFVRVACVAGILLGWPSVVIALSACLSVLSNDPAFVFIGALGGLALLGRQRLDGQLPRRELLAFGGGALAGLVAFAAFNVFRDGSVLNTYFTNADVPVPGTSVRASSFAALVAGPNVGLAWYWPLALGLLGGVAAIGWRRRRSDSRGAALAIAVPGVLVGILIFLTVFYSSFGWEAWGPRYLVGWIPPIVALAGYLYAAPLTRDVARLFAPRRRFIVVAALLIALALPQFGVFLDSSAAFRLFDPSGPCPMHMPDPAVYSRAFDGDMSGYYACRLHQAWGHRPALLDGYAVLGHPWAAFQGFLYAGALLMLLLQARVADPRALGPSQRRPS